MAGPSRAAKLVEPVHIELQLLADEVGQAAELGRVAEQENLADLRPSGRCR